MPAIIIKEELRRIYIWKGLSSSIRKKFIASRVASELQREITNSSHFHRCKIISVDQGDEPVEFLNAFGFKKVLVPIDEKIEEITNGVIPEENIKKVNQQLEKVDVNNSVIPIIEKNAKPKNILYLNFDDPELIDLEETIKTSLHINPDISYVFLDEIQNIKEWERIIRVYYDRKKFNQIFVSGSSASLISRDVGKTLTGRHVTKALTPFSFKGTTSPF